MMRFVSIPLRVLLPVLLVVGAATAGWIAWSLNSRTIDREIEAEFLAEARLRITGWQSTLEYLFRKGDLIGVKLEVSGMAARKDVSVAYAFDERDRIVAATKYADIGSGPEALLPELPEDLRDRNGERLAGVRRSLAASLELSRDRQFAVAYFPMLVSVDPHALRPGKQGVLVLVLNMQLAKARALEAVWRQVIEYGLLFGGLAVFVWALIHFSLTRRVNGLVAMARRFASGDLEARTGIVGHDELAQVARAFDAMAARVAADIHRREEAETQLRAGEQALRQAKEALEIRSAQLTGSVSLLHATIDSTADGILAVYHNGEAGCYNTQFTEMWGIPRTIAEQGSDALIAYAASQVKEPDAFVARAEEIHRHPEREALDLIELLDGRTFERYCKPQRIAGKCVGLVINFRDITGRKQAEEAQRQLAADLALERRRLEGILNSIPAVVFERWEGEEVGHRKSFVSRYVEEIHGYTSEEWLSDPNLWLNSIHPEDRGAVMAEAAAMKEGRRNQTKLVARWFRKNGQMFWSESHLVAIRGEAGEFLGVRGVAFDVTDRVRKDDELRWKTAFLEAQTDSALDGILVVDKDNRRLLQNQKLVEMWRVPEEIIKNPDDSQLLQYVVGLVKYPEQFLARVRQLYADPTEIGRDEVEFKDGRFLDRYSSPVLGKDGTYYGRIWTFRDITERKLAEAETQHLNKQLVEISRQAGMAEVATSVLHNVGNVLNSVNISCSVLSEKARKLRIESVGKVADILQANQQDLAAFFATDPIGLKLPAFLAKLAAHLGRDQEGILQELRLLGENVEHIKTIVSMQQSYARVSGMSEPANVVDLVNDSLRMNAESLTRSDIEPICKFSPVPSISVEKHKVLQILVNLIRNAKQACQETGLAGRQLILEVRHEGDRIGISVADNGVGILPEHLKRLFSHGFTTRPNGHGFGLHSSVLAAHDLGGRLHAYSEGRGCGATFTLELPVDGKPLPRE